MTTEASLGDDVFSVEKIEKKRIVKGSIQYFVKWRGWGDDHSSWEPKKNILDKRLIDAFELSERERSPQLKKRGPKPKRGRPSKLEKQMRNRELAKSKSPSPIRNRNNSIEEEETTEDEEEEEEEEESSDDEVVAEILPTSPLRKKVKHFAKETLKRKAEVIKESGKIGVTITTSPKTSPIAAQHLTTNHHMEEDKLATLRNALANHAHSLEKGKVAYEEEYFEDDEVEEDEDENANNNAPPAEYWINKQPVADQIVITDVMVNLMPVTIRECSTQSGFFKERDEAEKTST